MSANFTPKMSEPETPHKFTAWSHKVLPSVFDDSLSYYETLCKLIVYVNSLINIHRSLGNDVTLLCEAFEQLQGYCNEYFDNLDVQIEVNNKLDNMVKDGTLSRVIGSYVNPLYNAQVERIELLEARVDNITKLGEGSTTGDAELVDARIGGNGKTYENLGEAVRGQYSELKMGETRVELNGYNTIFTVGNGLSSGTGGVEGNGYVAITEFMRGFGGELVTTNCDKDSNGVTLNVYVYMYKSQSVSGFIDRVRLTKGIAVELDPECAYIRVMFGRGTSSGVMFASDDLKYFNLSITNVYRRIQNLFDNTFAHRESVTSDMHIDDLTNFGVYGWTGSTYPKGCPYSEVTGVMFVGQYAPDSSPSLGKLVQVVFCQYGMAFRFRTTTGFMPWTYSARINTVDSVKLSNLRMKNMYTFTPLKTIGSSHSSKPFEAGVTYTGAPYSAVHYYSNDVYYNRTLETLYSMFNNKDSAIYNNPLPSAVYCGGVCSSFVAWACGLPIYYTTYDMIRMLDFKEINSIEDIEIGDVLICNTTLGDKEDHVIVVSGINCDSEGVSAVELCEQSKPVFIKCWYTRAEMVRMLAGKQRVGNSYKVGRFKDTKIRTIPDFTVNTDIITEYGDNTYFEMGEAVYIQSANQIIRMSSPAGVDKEINLFGLPMKPGTDMYDISSHLDSVGRWTLYGSNNEESHITIIKKGTIAHQGNNNFTFSGYEGCKPCGYAVVALWKGTPGNGYPTHISDNTYKAGRLTVFSKDDHRYAGALNGDELTINMADWHPDDHAYYVRVFYETGCGQAYQDSPVVWVKK